MRPWGKFPIKCEAYLPVPACTFMLERQTALFRSLVDEARACPTAKQVMGMGDMSKVDTWREPDGVRVDKLIMRPSHRTLVPVANTFLTPDDLACYTTLHYDPREMRDGHYPVSVSATMPLLGNMVRCESIMLVEDLPEDVCRASLHGTLHIDLPLIGLEAREEVMKAAVRHHHMLAQIFDRYQQLRAQLMKTAVGRSALLSGVPEMELDMAEIASILQQAYTDDKADAKLSAAEREPGEGGRVQPTDECAEAAGEPGLEGPTSIAFGLQHAMADITAAMADAQKVSDTRTNFTAAADWNSDMGKRRDFWRKLDIARAPISAPMQKLVTLFLRGEGTAWLQKQMPAGGGGGAGEGEVAEGQVVGGTRGPSGSAGVAPPPQERAAGSAQAAPHEEPPHASQVKDETTTLGQKLMRMLGCYRVS